MKEPVIPFDSSLMAPCGMNCGTCLAYLREKNRCLGCWSTVGYKSKGCALCIIRNCELLNKTDSKFCYECQKFPCLRLKQLDKRYRTKYHVSFIENLLTIKVKGLDAFIAEETKRWECPSCGSVICVHRDKCPSCGAELYKKNQFSQQQIEQEYDRCLDELVGAGIAVLLPNSNSFGVIGENELEYPMPTKKQVVELFTQNQTLINIKAEQGFKRLQLTPVAMPTLHLVDLLEKAIIKHHKEEIIYQSRQSETEPQIPVRVNKEKQVWIWETLRQAMANDELVYYPKTYSSISHEGMTKSEAIHHPEICAVPGWSVGLIEDLTIMPTSGQEQVFGERKQLEVGLSPCEYLDLLKGEHYRGESGLLLEDFITKFLTRLESSSEVSHDVDDHNATWCLGQYLRISYADVVPTGRWIRQVGRVRLDMHRSRNKECTKSWGAVTMVRLH